MSETEAQEFEGNPHADWAVRLRHYDVLAGAFRRAAGAFTGALTSLSVGAGGMGLDFTTAGFLAAIGLP